MSEVLVAGWQRLSLIDYPGKLATVIFLAGCNMRCHYCHNRQIWHSDANRLSFQMILAELRRRRGWLDAVVVSGGEPTMHPDLIFILKALRKLGLSIKLDTNGTHPELVRKVVEARLVDYVALDIKAPVAKHRRLTGMSHATVWNTARYLKRQKRVAYMFRTTVSPQLTPGDLVEMGKTIVDGALCWQIQQCRTVGAYSGDEIRNMAGKLKPYALHIVVVGI